MSGTGATVPIKLTVSGQSDVVAAMLKVAKESRDAWRASLPEPKIIDTFEKTSRKAANTSSEVARTIQTNWRAITAESRNAALAMDQVAQSSQKMLAYSSVNKTGLGPMGIGITTIDRAIVSHKSLNSEVTALGQAVRSLPSIAAALGLSQLGLGVERLVAIRSAITAVRALGVAGAAAVAAPVAAQVAGILAGGIPIAYDVWAMRKTAETRSETMRSREENNLKLLSDIVRFVKDRQLTGQIRGGGDSIIEEAKQMVSEQEKAKKDSDPIRGAVGSDITSRTSDLLKRTTAIIQAGYEVEQQGALAHAEALKEIDSVRFHWEEQSLKTALDAKLRDTNASEADQIDAARTFVDRMRGIAVESAAAQTGVLSIKEGNLKGELLRTGNDPDAIQRIKNELQSVADERLKIEQETDSKLEALEAEHVARVEKVRLDYAKRQADEAERFAREQEKAAADAERAAKQAQRDAERLLQTRQQELQARMAAVGSDFRLTNAQKYDAESNLIEEGRDSGAFTGADADAYQSRLGANPSDLRQQMQAAIVDLQNMFGTVAQQIAAGFRNVIGTAVNSISDGITGLILRTKTWAQALREIGTSILTSLVHSIVQIGVQWAVGFALQKTLGKMAVKSAISDAATLAAAWGPPAVLAAIATEGSAAGVGLATTIAAMAIGTGAATAMSGSGMGFADGGYTGNGPRYEVAGYVHRGEYVMDANAVRRIGVPALQALQAGGAPAPTPVQSGPSGSVINIAMMDTPSKIRHFFESEEGENLYVDMGRKTYHRIERR